MVTAKPCCSFEVSRNNLLGQFAFWSTGEADFDIMDADTKEFVRHEWGKQLGDSSFETAFRDFLRQVLQDDFVQDELIAVARKNT